MYVAMSWAVQPRCRASRGLHSQGNSGYMMLFFRLQQRNQGQNWNAENFRCSRDCAHRRRNYRCTSRPATGLTDQAASTHRSPHPHPCPPLSLTGLDRRSARRNFDPFLILGTASNFAFPLCSRITGCAVGRFLRFGGDSDWSLVKIPRL
jgi:hypothetical protein